MTHKRKTTSSRPLRQPGESEDTQKQEMNGFSHKRAEMWKALPYHHYSDVLMGAMMHQITSLTIVSGADQRKHQSSASLAFVRGIHRWPVNSPHKGPVTRKMFPFDDVIMHDVMSYCSPSLYLQTQFPQVCSVHWPSVPAVQSEWKEQPLGQSALLSGPVDLQSAWKRTR